MCGECGAIFGGGGGYAGLMLAESYYKVFGQSYVCLGILTPLRGYCSLVDYPPLVLYYLPLFCFVKIPPYLVCYCLLILSNISIFTMTSFPMMKHVLTIPTNIFSQPLITQC